MRKKNKNIKLKSTKKFNRKKIIIIVLLAFIFVLSAFIGFSAFKGEEPLVADNYTIENDTVESITTVTERGNLIAINPYQEEGKNIIEYVYESEEDFQTAIDDYKKYLLEEKEFMELESDESEENSVFAIKSSEPDKIFKLSIAQKESDYSITVSREDGELPQKVDAEELVFTRDDARNYLKNFINNSKELPLAFDSYTNIFDVGRSFINGEECYGMNIYQKGQSNCNEFVGKYYISLMDKNIYKYSSETGQSVALN